MKITGRAMWVTITIKKKKKRCGNVPDIVHLIWDLTKDKSFLSSSPTPLYSSRNR